MDVEFDPSKDRENRRNHRISLQRAEDFDMSAAAIEPDTREDYGEERFNALGFLDGRLYSLTFTLRGSAVRAISLRKANKQERKSYEKAY
jgi:uncharacterized DUF497 family protein